MIKAKQLFLLFFVLILCCTCLSVPSVHAAAAYYICIAVPQEQDGILTLENGERWYKVRHFEDDADYLLTVKNAAGEQMLLAVTNDFNTRYVWNYYRYTMTTSTAPRVALLNAGGFSLAVNGSTLTTSYTGDAYSDHTWSHEDAALCYCENGTEKYLKYDADCAEPISMTAEKSEASEVILYSRAETLERCITRQPESESYVIEGSGYPAPTFSVGLSEVTADRIRWFIDGEEQPCRTAEFTAERLTGLPAGVHRVSCLVEAHDSEGVHYRERSADAAFVIAKGVVPDSILSFSDVHEEYGLISDAIAAVIDKTGGYIPSLVICTGDFVYGPTVEKERELNRYFPQIMAHLGGLDAVFVAGNHDSAAAASVMSSAAGLGADEALSANGGLLFDGDSAANLSHGRNSRSAKGIITYGIHFDAAIRNTAEGICYTYEDVIRDVESFLQKTAAQYHGELVVISAHSGLHVIGEQPESVSLYHSPLSAWLGENMYNVDCSYELAQTINRYAEQYDMDILYLFGHDHSRSEAEMFLTEGDTLFSTMHYADRSIGSQKLHFTYAHAGYLSSVIGCADRRFTFIYRDGSRFRYDLLHSDGSVEREEIFTAKNQYKAPVSEHTAALPVVTEASAASADAQTTTVTNMQTANPSSAPQSQTSAAVTAAGTVASAEKNAGVNTGEEQHLTMIAVPALFVLLLSRNRKKDPKA